MGKKKLKRFKKVVKYEYEDEVISTTLLSVVFSALGFIAGLNYEKFPWISRTIGIVFCAFLLICFLISRRVYWEEEE